jgi:hypothetical protein
VGLALGGFIPFGRKGGMCHLQGGVVSNPKTPIITQPARLAIL